MLATAAHAAAALGENILARCRFIVLDRCAKPLIICQEFAAQHRLLSEARREDMHAAISVAAGLIANKVNGLARSLAQTGAEIQESAVPCRYPQCLKFRLSP